MTARLKLRQWRAADLEPFASLNADPVVIEFLSRCLTRAESDEFAERGVLMVQARGITIANKELTAGGIRVTGARH